MKTRRKYRPSATPARKTLARIAAALLVLTFIRPLWAAPGDITQVPAPMMGADPPAAKEIGDGDASVSTQTGALTYAFPITAPPGRLGMQPALALTYSSQSPTYGGIAANWTLAIPEIRLDTSESYLKQKYFAGLSPDPWARERFVSTLSGSRPLVPVTEDHESTVYQTYRAQNDASWVRYERMNDGEPYLWRARTPDGITHYFGDASLGATSRTVVPLTRSVDSFGNTVSYTWADGQISQISYTSNPDLQMPAFAQVEFEYITESCGRLPVGAAEDLRLGWVDGAKRLTKIRAITFDPNTPSPHDVKHQREYWLKYDPAALLCTSRHAPLRILTSIEQSVVIPGVSQVDLPPVTFEYNRLERAFDSVTSQSVGGLWAIDPEMDSLSLSTGKRFPTGWPSVNAMMLDFDGDGLPDRIEHVEYPTDPNACAFRWSRNLGSDSAGALHFASPIEQVMPRLPWEGEDRQPAEEHCTLNYQFTMRENLGDPPGACDLNYGSYLAYRWMDITGDGRIDLVAAAHHDYHYDPGQESKAEFFADLHLEEGWPSCTPDGGACPALSSECMQDALVCDPEEPCRLNESAVVACLADADPVTCDRLMRGMDQFGPSDPDQNQLGPIWPGGTPPPGSNCGLKKEHRQCDRYPWFVYENVGGAFEPIGEVKLQPVPLESDGGDSTMNAGGGGFNSTSHAVADMDGDGFLDVAVRGRYSETWIASDPIWWFVFLGDGTGAFQPSEDGQPYVWYVPDNAQIQGTCPQGLANLCDPGVLFDSEFHVAGYSSLLDLNGDDAADFVWTRDANSQLQAQAFWGDGLSFRNFGASTPAGDPVGDNVGLMSRSYVHADVQTQFGPDAGWTEEGWRQSHIQTIDVDDDGRIDLVQSTGEGFLHHQMPTRLHFNDGGTMLSPHNLDLLPSLQDALIQRTIVDHTSIGFTWSTKRDLLDMDGDGLPEHWNFLAAGPAGGVAVRRDQSDQPLRLLKRVLNGRGGAVDITYAPTTDDDVVAQQPERLKSLPHTQWVVQSIRVSDQWEPAADVSTTLYEYDHPIWNQDERNRWGFRGFENVTTTAPSGSRTVNTYGYDVDWSGRLSASRVFSTEQAAGPRTISETTWVPLSLFQGAITTYHTSHVRSWTCGNAQSEAACRASASGFQHKIWNYRQLPESGPAQLYFADKVFNLDTETYSVGGRRSEVAAELYSDADDYRFQETLNGGRVLESPFIEAWTSHTTFAYDPSYKSRIRSETTFDMQAPQGRAVTTWTYHPSGVVLSEQHPRNYPNGDVTEFAYDPTYRFLTSTTNEFEQVVYREYEPGTGAVLSERGPNSSSCGSGCTNWEQTWTDVDGLGRPTATYANVPLAGSATWQKVKTSRNTYTDWVIAGARTKVVTESLIEWGANRWTREETRLDGKGRPAQILVNTDLTPDAITTYDYDHRGLLVSVTLPDPSQLSSGTVMYTYGYDSLGRSTSIRRPAVGGPIASGLDWSYDGLNHERHEVAGSQGGSEAVTKLRNDNFGRLVEVREYVDSGSGFAGTTYEYDALDAVRRIVNPDGVVTELFHDMGGRRTRIDRAGKSWTYRYYPSGDLESETVPPLSPLGIAAYTTTYVYDELGRPSSRSPGVRTITTPTEQSFFGVGTISFQHDSCSNGVGRLCTVVHPGGVLTTAYTYDAEGNSASEARAFSFAGVTGTRTSSTTYGPLGKVIEQTYADNAIGVTDATRAKFAYDDRALPITVRWVRAGVPGELNVATQSRNLSGLVVQRATSFQVPGWREHYSSWFYDKLSRVASQTITDSQSWQLAKQQFDYFGSDDPKRLRHWGDGSYYNFDLTYDARHQLQTVSEDGGRFGATYDLTLAGKLSHVNVWVDAPPNPGADVIPRNVNYVYNSASDPEAVSALTPLAGGAALRTYSYDTAGNMESRAGGSTTDAFLYDGEDQLRRATVTDNATATTTKEEYFYDHVGQRAAVVTRTTSGAVNNVRVFLGDSEIVLTPSGALDKAYAYISLGTPVARVTNRAGIELQYHGLANNTLLSLSPDGTTQSGFVYAPYGELLESTGSALVEQHRRLNDKYRDGATALFYYGVRYYDGLLLRWTQADPLYRFSPDAAWEQPRRGNLYSFSYSNPVRYIDPDGRDIFSWATVKRIASTLDPRNAPTNRLSIEAVKLGIGYFRGEQSAASTGRRLLSNSVRMAAFRAGAGGPLVRALANAIDDRTPDRVDVSEMEPPVPVATPASGAAGSGGGGGGFFSTNWTKVGGVPKAPTGRGTTPPSARDPKRLYTRDQKAEKLTEQQGHCAGCGKPLEVDEGQGHHVQRHADGGPTTQENHVILCVECHIDVHRP